MKDIDPQNALTVQHVPVTNLKPYPGNPRTHSKKQIRQIADSIETFGWTNPILVDEDNGVIAGHGRLEAAKLLGQNEVPVLRIDHMTDEQKRAYVIADNRLAENAGWDEALLALELGALVDLEFDVTLTGFETAEIDMMLRVEGTDEADPRDEIAASDKNSPAVTSPGDLWHLGPHRVLCADATDADNWSLLMQEDRAEMVFTDPPYNVPIRGHVSGLGAVQHREFAMAAGEMTPEAFSSFLEKVCGNMAAVSREGAIHFICMDWAHLYELLRAGQGVYTDLKNICVWAKTNGGMGSLYRSQHEMVAVFKSGKGSHINNVELGRHGRYRTNVWSYPGMNSFGSERDVALAMHPTVKPVALVEDAILDCSNRNGVVVDAFLGSGTTLIAAESAGRKCYGMELDPHYVDLIIERWQKVTGETAVLGENGLAFDVLR